YPDRAGTLAARHGYRDDAVQPDGVLLGDVDRSFLRETYATADRPLWLRALYGGAAVARFRCPQRLERNARVVRAYPVRDRAGFVGDVAVQRIGHGLSQGACRRR